MNQQTEVKDTACFHSFRCLSFIQQTENLTGHWELWKKKSTTPTKNPTKQPNKQTKKKHLKY